jgi:hypothetical protein
MPLLDHFHSPLSQQRPWESFHSTWATAIADALNRDILPPGFIALEQIHGGAGIEIDVGAFTDATHESADNGGGVATSVRKIWTPAAKPLILPGAFPPSSVIEIVSTEGGRTLVAAIELVSPGNKDRATKRRLFAAKCATYLSRGIGLIIIDAVTSRQGNLHNEMVDLIGWSVDLRMQAAPAIYCVAYRPLHEEKADRVETWPFPLTVGEPLPVVPLSLAAEHCVEVDLETSYADACLRRRLDEVGG